MKLFATAMLAAAACTAAAIAPADETPVWTTWYLGPHGTTAVSTQDADRDVINALIARHGLVRVETGTSTPAPGAGIKHILLHEPDTRHHAAARGDGPTALNDCTDFASNPGMPFQVTNANLPYAQDFNVTGAANGGDWRGACQEMTSLGDGREAFVQFTPDVTGDYVVKGHFFRDATPTTVRAGLIGVWELPGCTGTQPLPAESTGIGCALDLFGNSSVVVTLTAGTTYYVILEDNFGSTPEDTAHIEISGPVTPEAESCSVAFDLTASSWESSLVATGDTTNNPDDGDSEGDCTPGEGDDYGPDYWFLLPPTVAGSTYTIELEAGTMTDSVLTIYSGSCGSLVPVACNDDAEGGDTFMSKLSFVAEAGETYYAQVESYHFAGLGQGSFTLTGTVQGPLASVGDWQVYE